MASKRQAALPGAPHRGTRKRTRGWRMPAGAIYVGRPTKWGNPFIDIATAGEIADELRPLGLLCETREEAVQNYRGFLCSEEGRPLLLDLVEIRGHNLYCWCEPGEVCHADVLLELANGPLALLAQAMRTHQALGPLYPNGQEFDTRIMKKDGSFIAEGLDYPQAAYFCLLHEWLPELLDLVAREASREPLSF